MAELKNPGAMLRGFLLSRHCERSEAIQARVSDHDEKRLVLRKPQAGSAIGFWIASSRALLAMTVLHPTGARGVQRNTGALAALVSSSRRRGAK